MKYLNGWTRETMLARIEEKNGWVRCRDSMGCMYRDKYGRTCVVGAFIPDDEYREEMEGGYGPDDVLDPTQTPIDIGCMCLLQSLHDTEAYGPKREQEFHDPLVEYVTSQPGWSRETCERFLDIYEGLPE